MSLCPGFRMIHLFLFVFGVFVQRAFAGGFGVCVAGWEWANNTLQQNPCEIAGALEAPCGGFSSYVVGPLAQGSNFITPQKNDSFAQKCNCNTVMFSLYMACTGCQNVTTQSWTFWSQFCDQVFVTQFPGDIPLDTAVPHWAFLNYTVGDKFDPVAARAAGGLPELFAPVPSTISLSSTSMSSLLPSLTMNGPVTTPTINQGRKSSHGGAIAGGVIGGLAALVLVGIGALILRKRLRARGDQGYSEYHRVSAAGPIVSEFGGKPNIRLYDPYDPSTFPTTEYAPSAPYTSAHPDGRYTGVPEL